ncbi:MAG: hypothetical protein ACJLUP_00765 [Agrobacterium tumefaciens]
MFSVSEQVEGDPDLTRPLLSLRHFLASTGNPSRLENLLPAWDSALAHSDFTDVAEHFRLLLCTLLGLTDEESQTVIAEFTLDDEGTLDLLRRAIAGPEHEAFTASDAEFLDDVCCDLAGLLEALYPFTDADAYVIARRFPEWCVETVDYDELSRSDPILLSELFFEVEAFVSNLDTARRSWRRWLTNKSSAPAVV